MRRILWITAIAVLLFAALAAAGQPFQIDITFVEQRLSAAFRGMEALVDEQTGLPVDIGVVTENRITVKDAKTSPTNIGMLIATLVAACDQGYLAEEKVKQQLAKILDTLEKTAKYEGFFYNWYNLSDLTEEGAPAIGAPTVDPDAQRFISSVDNANLTVAMMVAAAAFPDDAVSKRFKALINAQDYSFFFHYDWRDWPRISHGYFVERGEFSPFDYGTFMTEARMLVLLAILKGDVPEHPWCWSPYQAEYWGEGYMEALPTICEMPGGEKIVVISSWGGSLFEELFPDLFLDEKTLSVALAENHRGAVEVQIAHADPLTGLWGWSPSETVEGVYKEAGVPCLGSGGLYPIGDVSPYSILLAARHAPEEAIETLQRIEGLNDEVWREDFGYRDCISRDGEKVGPHILALDKGMETLALFNLVREMEGKQGIAQCFWEYMDSIGSGDKGREILTKLRFDERFYTYEWQPIATPADEPIDVFREFSDWCIGGGSGGRMDGEPGFSWAYSPPQALRYDVTPRTSFAYYASLSLDAWGYRKPVDISRYNTLKIRFKGGEEFPTSFKVEFKANTILVQAFIVKDVTTEWQEVMFRVYGDFLGEIDEIVVTMEHHRAKIDDRGSLTGSLQINRVELLYLSEED